MKLNKHIMAMNLAAVIAFGAVAGIVAPSIAGDDTIVAFAADVSGDVSGDAAKKEEEASKKAGEKVTFDDATAKELEGYTFEYNGDGETITLTEVNKTATKIKLKGTVKNAAGKDVKITKIQKNAFKDSAAKSIDLSDVELTELTASQFGAKKATSLKINAKNIKKASSVNKKFAKGMKKLKKMTVIMKKSQVKKFQPRFKTAATKTGNKKGTKLVVKKVKK
ncbi:hypothetical protein [Butyrivibrio sp. WCD2001]|uniref:hypothetical protein n=1 Tax=Butyrivibrio sp. WCD2001 TaxID=1280681 RepID=UPI00040A84E6|nr:hypothetical protein [Butyrivibrio sp. WCD2001]